MSRSLVALIAVVLVGMTGFGVFMPIFPFLALHTGAGPTAVTIAMGAYSLGQLISSPLWGRLSDRIGRKPVLIIGLLGTAVSYIALAHVETIEAMFAARLASGLMAGNVGAAFAAAADLADDRTRARNMGLLGAAFAFGFIAGPALGALLVGAGEPTTEDFANVCYMAGSLGFAAAVGALLLFRETLPPESRRPAHVPRVRRLALLASRPMLARFILVTLLMITAQALIESSFALWADVSFNWGPHEVGWTLAGLGVGAALLQGGGAGRAARTLGEPRTLMLGLGAFAIGMGAAAVAHEAIGAVAALVALVLGAGLSTPALQSLIAAQAEPDERGAVMGLNQSASSLGRVLGPLGAGAVFEHVGKNAPFAAAALLLVLALLAVLTRPKAIPVPAAQ
ncbi:MFS transporter [Terricaulis sp.]|uniref:MFS transporter n=1 Tax=Terricaulis sp. TaxID=2768686 RepID=UPI00378504D7